MSQLLPKPAYSITTLPSNGSPPTSSTRLPAGFSRGGKLVSAFLHRLPGPALAARVDVCGWVCTGPCGGSQGAPKGDVVDGVAP